MTRPVQPLGTYGQISVKRTGPGRYVARARYRDADGRYVRVTTTASASQLAANALKSKVADHVAEGEKGELHRNPTLAELAEFWVTKVRVSGRQAPQTLDAYEENLRTVVLPALGALWVREVTVGRVDRFLNALAPEHPHACSPGASGPRAADETSPFATTRSTEAGPLPVPAHHSDVRARTRHNSRGCVQRFEGGGAMSTYMVLGPTDSSRMWSRRSSAPPPHRRGARTVRRGLERVATDRHDQRHARFPCRARNGPPGPSETHQALADRRRTLSTGDDRLTEKQRVRLKALVTVEEHDVKAT